MATTPITIDFTDPAIQANPYPTYEELRRERPVFWNGNAWLVAKYDDVVSILTDDRMSSQRVDATFSVLPPEIQQELAPLRHILGERMLLSDPPKHTRLRKLVMQAFSAKAAQGRRDRIETFANMFIDKVIEQGEMDVMADYANRIPGYTVADVLGVPNDNQAQFAAWAEDQVRVYDRPGTHGDRVAVMRKGQESMLAMKAYVDEIIAERRLNPQDDLITELVQAEEDGDRLTNDEMVAMIVAVLVGGNNSTAHLIGNATLTLLRFPDVRQQLLDDPALIRPIIEEVMRWESPVQATSRVVKEDMEFSGHQFSQGDNVSILVASANRDEEKFDHADSFDFTRRPNRHLTFIVGPHYCLGSALARNIAQVSVLTLFERCKNMQLATDRLEWSPTFSFRHLERLPVTFNPQINRR